MSAIEVLTDHHLAAVFGDDAQAMCRCGWSDSDDAAPGSAWRAHSAHLTQVLTAAAATAEAGDPQ